MKKIFYLSLASVLVLCNAAFAVSNGTCGTGCTYTLDDNGLLIVTGTGENAEIESNAFYGNMNIRDVIIQGTIKTIGTDAFHGTGNDATSASNIRSVDMSNSEVEVIDVGAFYGNRSLASLKFSPTLETISYGAFKNGSGKISSLIFPDTLKTIGNQAFAWGWNLTDVRIPESIEYIDSLYSITSGSAGNIYCPESKKTICENAFIDSSTKSIRDMQVYVYASDGNSYVLKSEKNASSVSTVTTSESNYSSSYSPYYGSDYYNGSYYYPYGGYYSYWPYDGYYSGGYYSYAGRYYGPYSYYSYGRYYTGYGYYNYYRYAPYNYYGYYGRSYYGNGYYGYYGNGYYGYYGRGYYGYYGNGYYGYYGRGYYGYYGRGYYGYYGNGYYGYYGRGYYGYYGNGYYNRGYYGSGYYGGGYYNRGYYGSGYYSGRYYGYYGSGYYGNYGYYGGGYYANDGYYAPAPVEKKPAKAKVCGANGCTLSIWFK